MSANASPIRKWGLLSCSRSERIMPRLSNRDDAIRKLTLVIRIFHQQSGQYDNGCRLPSRNPYLACTTPLTNHLLAEVTV